uniref:Uncharacterized protein n=1 Tax=Amphimedon queenslandica TaxID=400682 RepID=A0A1X7UET1_AMPQE
MVTNSIVTTGMILDDIYAICSKTKEKIGKWLKREGVVGDFTDCDCPKCRNGRISLTMDTSYSRISWFGSAQTGSAMRRADPEADLLLGIALRAFLHYEGMPH